MLKPKPILKLVCASLLFCLTNCASVHVSDAEVCADAGVLGASCVRILSAAERDIEKPAWDTERFGMICTSSENFKEWRANLEKLCKETKLCNYEAKQKIKEVADLIEQVSLPVHPIYKP